VVPEVKAIFEDKSMGLSGTNVNQVPLWIVQLTPGTSDNMLLAVSWRDDSFGVDGPIWVVEAGKKGAVNLTPRENSSQLWGFGVKALLSKAEAYPRIQSSGLT
jgi:hypothetical protein